jgi:hypothetical protein
MNWVVPKIWEDEEVWILGGGASVAKQFEIPDKVIKSVMDGTSQPSVYSPFMESIHKKHVIGINIAFMIGDWMDIIFFGDNGFFNRYAEGLANYPGIRATCTSQIIDPPNWVKLLTKDLEHPRGISTFPSMVSWNGNSGAAAISIAANAGAKRIVLLGFDMNLSESNHIHWHDVYQRGKITTEDQKKRLVFDRHLKGFEQIAKDARKRGIEILNASPTSEIKEFPKVTVKSLL